MQKDLWHCRRAYRAGPLTLASRKPQGGQGDEEATALPPLPAGPVGGISGAEVLVHSHSSAMYIPQMGLCQP